MRVWQLIVVFTLLVVHFAIGHQYILQQLQVLFPQYFWRSHCETTVCEMDGRSPASLPCEILLRFISARTWSTMSPAPAAGAGAGAAPCTVTVVPTTVAGCHRLIRCLEQQHEELLCHLSSVLRDQVSGFYDALNGGATSSATVLVQPSINGRQKLIAACIIHVRRISLRPSF